jgi:hypothetical protein
MSRAAVSLTLAAVILAGCYGVSNHDGFGKDSTARQIPFLSDAPKLDRQAMAGEWDNALSLNGTFSIRDGTPAAGEYPFNLSIGHNEKFLFGWLAVHQVPPNPYSRKAPPDYSDRYGHALGLFLDTKLGTQLESPESWKDSVFIEGSTHSVSGYWDDAEWTLTPEDLDPEGTPWEGDRPTSGTWFRGWADDQDINWEFYVPLKSPSSDRDGFTVETGDIFRMCLLFEVQGGTSPDQRGLFEAPRDTFPSVGYTPHGHYDPTTWLRLQLA